MSKQSPFVINQLNCGSKDSRLCASLRDGKTGGQMCIFLQSSQDSQGLPLTMENFIAMEKSTWRLHCKGYLGRLVDSYVPVPWAPWACKQSETKATPWLLCCCYRTERKASLWTTAAGLGAWETAESVFPSVTASLTLRSQRAESKDHRATKTSALTSEEFAGSTWVMNWAWHITHYPQDEGKQNRDGWEPVGKEGDQLSHKPSCTTWLA